MFWREGSSCQDFVPHTDPVDHPAVAISPTHARHSLVHVRFLVLLPVCVCVCARRHVCGGMCACVCVRTHVYRARHTYAHMSVYTHTDVCVSTYVRIHVCLQEF